MRIPAYVRVLTAGAAVTLAMGAATNGSGPVLLVANQGDHTLSVVDPVAGKEIATIPVGGVTGHEVEVSPDGKFAYVPIYGNSGVGAPGTNGSTMSVIDIAARKVVSTVDFGHGVRPHKPIYNAATKKLYVTTELDKAITVLDPKTLKIEGPCPTGAEQSHMLVVSKDGKPDNVECPSRLGVGFKYGRPQNDYSDPDLKLRAANFALPGWPLGVHLGPDAAPDRDDRPVVEYRQAVDCPASCGIWLDGNAGWEVSAGGDAAR